jgi:acetate kinase
MLIVSINCGSSSLKVDLVDTIQARALLEGAVDRIGPTATLRIGENREPPAPLPTHLDALQALLPRLLEAARIAGVDADIRGVGHRVVHGGERFADPVLIDDDVVTVIAGLVPLAPLHNPANLAGIAAARALLPSVPHVAVFDTAFHATLPSRARAYALPEDVVTAHGLRRYGFHGISHEFVAERAAGWLDADPRDLRLITCHLGNGASLCAVEYGRSVETSMGLTPLEGLVMGTRSGDLDPGVVLQLMREGFSLEQLDELLNRRSGLAGLSGRGNDMRDIESAAASGDERARLTLHVFAHRVRKYIGAYAAVMGGVDAIVFTAGIGENSAATRHRIAQRLEFLGARFDEDRNRTIHVDSQTPVAEFGDERARCRLLAVRTDEQLAIARHTAALVQQQQRVEPARRIPVAVSARHVHLDQATVELLFGTGYQLTERNPLSQPGQFACHETVTLVGPRRTLENVRILGPARSLNQVEISRTDEFFLGIDAPVRASGDVANTPGIRIIGPAGTVDLKHGVICAWRHIHMHPSDALAFGVRDRDVVEVAVQSNGRALTFGDVLIRVSEQFALEMHIDTDEGNAAEISDGATGELVRRRTRFDA